MRILAVAVAIIGLILIGLTAFAWRSAMPLEDPSQRTAFEPALIQKGAQLAAVGNCIACHTVPGQKAFAGGLAIPTPFGQITSTNITPDPETGIGRWSAAAFQRAMREGVDRAGNHLYPAFPYDHFTHVTDEDNRALYAYLMTREPVRARTPEHDLAFPFNIRLLLAGWKLLYLEKGPFTADASESEEWNRGAYLAEGLGHCGACHTPRNRLGALDRSRHFAGGEAEGWQAYAIDASSPAPIPWEKESLAFYLRHGWHEWHGVSRGPMAEVTGNLGSLPQSDINAIATYVMSVMGEPSPERREQGEKLRQAIAGSPGGGAVAEIAASDQGEAIYVAACASCHESRTPLPFGGLNFALSTAVNAPDPQNIINVTLFGLPPADGEASSVMPAFAHVLDDAGMAALLAYMRGRFSDKPAWTDVAERVRRTRSGEHRVAIRPADGIERAPMNVGAGD